MYARRLVQAWRRRNPLTPRLGEINVGRNGLTKVGGAQINSQRGPSSVGKASEGDDFVEIHLDVQAFANPEDAFVEDD